MEDKIKVNISRRVYDILHKDMELFEFYKPNGTLNQNLFYTTLIVSFYQMYQDQENQNIKAIRQKIKRTVSMKDIDLDELSFELAQEINRASLSLDDEKFDHFISIKPTKSSMAVMTYIETYLLKQQSLSNFYRMLFSTYAIKSQDARERIIFRPTVELIQKAIDTQSMVFFTTAKDQRKDEISPYLIQNSKEELFNYVLGTINDQPYSFRLSRISNVTLLNQKSSFSADAKHALERMRQSPQYAIELGEKDVITVELSARGVEMFRAIYIHRPTPVDIHDNLYTFQCSHQQIFQYFTRFGHHAFVRSPEALSKRIESYYRIALKHYTKKHS